MPHTTRIDQSSFNCYHHLLFLAISCHRLQWFWSGRL